MAVVRFSRLAEADLLAIGTYTLQTWGPDQAALYLGELEICCQALANNPGIGRASDDIRLGLLRFEHGRHAVFYRQEKDGIRVSRILHERMLPTRYRLTKGDDSL